MRKKICVFGGSKSGKNSENIINSIDNIIRSVNDEINNHIKILKFEVSLSFSSTSFNNSVDSEFFKNLYTKFTKNAISKGPSKPFYSLSVIINSHSIIERKNIHDQSLLNDFSLTDILLSNAIKAKTSPMLAMFEPTTLFMAIDGELFKAALILTISSGKEVAKETTVIPITNFEILNLRDRATDALTMNSPPITSKKNPKKIKAKFIYLIIIL